MPTKSGIKPALGPGGPTGQLGPLDPLDHPGRLAWRVLGVSGVLVCSGLIWSGLLGSALLAGWLLAGWLLAGWLLAGSLARYLRKVTPCQKVDAR